MDGSSGSAATSAPLVGAGASGALRFRRQVILLVDDEVDILDALKSFLEASLDGVAVRVAESGPAALGLLRQEKADLIVSDYKMPQMNGIDFLRETQTLVPQAARILITAYPDMEIALGAIKDAAIENFVIKPFDASHFLDVVGAALYALRAEELRKRSLARSLELLNRRGRTSPP